MGIIKINDYFHLSEITLKDVNAFVEYLNDKEIYNNTLSIPYPYTNKDGEWFVNFVEERKKENGKVVNWAIRNKDEKLIGVVGFHDGVKGHKAEIDYGLANPYWSKGIMSEAVQKICDIGFYKFGLKRITATIFEHNIGSEKVLEKCGFILECVCLKKYYKKDENIFNGKLYAKTI